MSRRKRPGAPVKTLARTLAARAPLPIPVPRPGPGPGVSAASERDRGGQDLTGGVDHDRRHQRKEKESWSTDSRSWCYRSSTWTRPGTFTGRWAGGSAPTTVAARLPRRAADPPGSACSVIFGTGVVGQVIQVPVLLGSELRR